MLRAVVGMSRAEKACVTELIEARVKLEDADDFTDTSTPSGKESCLAFLKALENACETLKVEFASRSYRSAFTTNYKLLFQWPTNVRNYNMDLFKACADRQEYIFVNGDKFVLSAQTINAAVQLRVAWRAICGVLKPWAVTELENYLLEDVRSAIACLDLCWSRFEEVYILELIQIEAQAKAMSLRPLSSSSCFQPQRRAMLEWRRGDVNSSEALHASIQEQITSEKAVMILMQASWREQSLSRAAVSILSPRRLARRSCCPGT